MPSNPLILYVPLCERDVIEVVKGIDRRPQSIEVLFVDQKRVQCLVDGLVVVVLHGAQVRLHQWDVTSLLETKCDFIFPSYSMVMFCIPFFFEITK